MLKRPHTTCRGQVPVCTKSLDTIVGLLRSAQAKANSSSKKAKLRRKIISDEALLDVFLSTNRSTLDALEFTCYRFNRVCARTDAYCLRTLSIDLVNMAKARDLLGDEECSPTNDVHGMYRLKMQAEENDGTSLVPYQTWTYESPHLLSCSAAPSLMDHCVDQLPNNIFVRTLRLLGILDKLHDVISWPGFASRISCGTILIDDDWISAEEGGSLTTEEILPLMSHFKDVRSLRLKAVDMTPVTDAFLDACREKGILQLRLDDYSSHAITLEGLMSFWLGPTRRHLKKCDRSIDNLCFGDNKVFDAVLEAARKHDSMSTFTVLLHISDDFVESYSKGGIRALLLKSYRHNNEHDYYFIHLDNGYLLEWRLRGRDGLCINVYGKIERNKQP